MQWFGTSSIQLFSGRNWSKLWRCLLFSCNMVEQGWSPENILSLKIWNGYFHNRKGKSLPELLGDKCIPDLTFLVDTKTYLNKLNFKEKAQYCLDTFSVLSFWSETDLMHTHVHWWTKVPPHSSLNNCYRILHHTNWMANAKKQICNHHSVAPKWISMKILWFYSRLNYIHMFRNHFAVNIMMFQQGCKWRWLNYRITTLWKLLLHRDIYCIFMLGCLFQGSQHQDLLKTSDPGIL